MINILDAIAFSVSFAIIMMLLVLLVRSRIKHKNTAADLVEALIFIDALRAKLSSEISKKEEKNIEQTEGFLKFVSDSRDWAFQYIEEVQAALEEFDSKMEPILQWSKTYGIVNGDNAHTEALENISLAYEQLKKIMPENTETPNN